ncbi:acyl carrier protein [Streptomyces spiroverticillatus]|uniref:Acyl carrier protein n=1 Tax=Streptomyces finlayi TaxID=67296 RepID=A0A918X8E6_9ACTN|nr:acyl carrier protein [Streptomyces finlayi]GHA43994.1 acyl carrier protein [Streptomyces spiroverticillatus]GHD17558.1 acyl carrier protein [Streptomyces finlayi]
MTTGTTSADAILVRVAAMLEDKLGLLPEEIVPEARFTNDLGLDSLDMVELLTIMEAETGSPVEDDTAHAMNTIGDVITYLVEHGAGETE